jgi:hypothetical protein
MAAGHSIMPAVEAEFVFGVVALVELEELEELCIPLCTLTVRS